MLNKVISHPYEINCLKTWEMNRKLVCSQTDTKELFIWDLYNQDNVEYPQNCKANLPDLLLKGHTDDAGYALDWHKTEPIVASGGKDKKILLWNLDDYFVVKNKGYVQSYLSDSHTGTIEQLEATTTLTGHTENVEDLCFNPSNPIELCSSSQDQTVLFWDTRAGNSPVNKVEDIHSDDIN